METLKTRRFELNGLPAGSLFLALTILCTNAAIAADKDWLHYGGNPWNERHAELKEITKENVAQLTPRHILQIPTPMNGLVGSPLVVDGVLYMPSSNGWVHAFDLRSSQKIWSFEHKGNYGPQSGAGLMSAGFGSGGAPTCCSNQTRAVGYANGTIFTANIDASVIAIDAKTGKKKWEVLGVAKEDNPGGIYGYNSQPVIAGDNIVIGTTGGEAATRHHITAYDQATGKQVWRWYAIPAPDGSDPVAPSGWWKFSDTTAYGVKLPYRDLEQEKQLKDVYPNTWKVGGGPVWMPVVFDPELNLIFASVGNPNPDMDGRPRPGDNLFTNSIVAIDATTGKTRWYFQIAPHDLWDRDPASPPVVTMLEGRKVVVQAGKIGWLFVLDAKTGEFIRMSEAFVPQENMWAAPGPTMGPWVSPAGSGGNEWSPISVDRERKLGFVGALYLPFQFQREKKVEKDHLGRPATGLNLGGTWNFDMKKQRGYFSAIDLTTGKIKWQVKSPTLYVGGVMSTSTGLVFLGEAEGNLAAFDADTGSLLWQYNTGAGVNAPPIAFELDGEEFVAVAAGGSKMWGTQLGNSVVVFGLPKKWEPTAKK
jgi:PQQ-dependent dehydrogenase (methanol/ethanol family)